MCSFAAQVSELQAGHKRMLQAMLSNLAGTCVSLAQANEVELRCLEGLHWRLGPYYAEDRLGEGHWGPSCDITFDGDDVFQDALEDLAG